MLVFKKRKKPHFDNWYSQYLVLGWVMSTSSGGLFTVGGDDPNSSQESSKGARTVLRTRQIIYYNFSWQIQSYTFIWLSMCNVTKIQGVKEKCPFVHGTSSILKGLHNRTVITKHLFSAYLCLCVTLSAISMYLHLLVLFCSPDLYSISPISYKINVIKVSNLLYLASRFSIVL